MRGVVTLAEDVKLVPLSEVDPVAVGRRIHQLIYGGRSGTADPWVAGDFPQMVPSYRTPEIAEARIRKLVEIAEESEGERGFLVVMHNDVIVGMATYGQQTLETHKGRWPFRKTIVHADGPLVAGWLARHEHRPHPHPYLLLGALRALAVHMVANSALHGRPWTLVRANRGDRQHVEKCLGNTNNGFGGFEVIEQGAFPQVDGVEAPRKLFEGLHPIDAFRD